MVKSTNNISLNRGNYATKKNPDSDFKEQSSEEESSEEESFNEGRSGRSNKGRSNKGRLKERSCQEESSEEESSKEGYYSIRKRLVEQEQQEAWDRKVQSNNDMEEEAAKIIQNLREHERKTTFGNVASESIPSPDKLDMGGQFLTNKNHIEKKSDLFKIAKMVPKGALLHLHFNAQLPVELLLKQARENKNMYIRSTRKLLDQKDLDRTEMGFAVLAPDKVDADVTIFSNKYQAQESNKEPSVWMKWSQFRAEFPKHFIDHKGEPEIELDSAESWLRKKMVLSEQEVYGITQTVNGIWARFNQGTRCFKGLLYETTYKWYIGKVIDSLIEEKVMYAELRPMLLDKSIPTDDGKGEIDNFAQMQVIIDVVKKKQKKLEKCGKLNAFPFGLKIVYCTPRSISKEKMKLELNHCLELKVKFPGLICGFDLVGAEDRPNHIGFYAEELVTFRKRCEKEEADIPFLFHAGETLLDTGGSSEWEKSNLYDAVTLNSKRIGHGFSLMKHPYLMEKFKKTATHPGICIELCLTSNELLGLCGSVKAHRYQELLAAGIPCTLNTDNPNLFGNSMSHEFYQAIVGATSMSLYSWKQLAQWSIEYSCLSDKDKEKGKVILNRDWKKFCRTVVRKYGKKNFSKP